MRKVTLCSNWVCPAWVSCAHAFGRSAEYAAASSDNVEFVRREVQPGKDSCPSYERDKPRPWLLTGVDGWSVTPTRHQ